MTNEWNKYSVKILAICVWNEFPSFLQKENWDLLELRREFCKLNGILFVIICTWHITREDKVYQCLLPFFKRQSRETETSAPAGALWLLLLGLRKMPPFCFYSLIIHDKDLTITLHRWLQRCKSNMAVNIGQRTMTAAKSDTA